jgi:N-acetylglucosamine-6-phosphate deacetylase
MTCDASPLAGLPTGRYADWGQEFEVLPGGKVVVPGTPYLAGSGCFTDTCVGVAAWRFGLEAAVEMASIRPRELLGLPAAPLGVGEPAELVWFDWQPGGALMVRQVVG